MKQTLPPPGTPILVQDEEGNLCPAIVATSVFVEDKPKITAFLLMAERVAIDVVSLPRNQVRYDVKAAEAAPKKPAKAS